MSKLDTAINLSRHDELYQQLLDLHEGRSEEESARINARLILILMNQIGDDKIVEEAIKLAQIAQG